MTPFEVHADEVEPTTEVQVSKHLVSRRLVGWRSAAPRTHILSNGQYSVMLSGNGGGYSRWRDLDVTRWRPDATLDNWGQFIYIRQMENRAER
jgi:cyclic beta-1,2-glucan synthetase